MNILEEVYIHTVKKEDRLIMEHKAEAIVLILLNLSTYNWPVSRAENLFLTNYTEHDESKYYWHAWHECKQSVEVQVCLQVLLQHPHIHSFQIFRLVM